MVFSSKHYIYIGSYKSCHLNSHETSLGNDIKTPSLLTTGRIRTVRSRTPTRRRSGPRRVQSLSVHREHCATHQPRYTDTHSGNDNT